MPLTPVTLEGTAVRLEPLRTDHLDALCAVGLEPALWRFTVLALETRADMAAYIELALKEQSAGKALPFVTVDRASRRVIGSTRYHLYSAEHRRLEIGYTWLNPAWQRTAINTEAKLLMLRHAFETLGCNRVEFKATVENHISRKALARLGAKEEGVLRSFRLSPRTGPRDIVQLSIIRPEWPDVKTALEAKLAVKRGEK
jgi:RimJ/RimL family protein N-acetyltransferase